MRRRVNPFTKVFGKELTSDILKLVLAEARRLLEELGTFYLDVSLAPAPDPQFQGHMIRIVNNSNPKWYKEIFAELDVKRDRIISSLKRVASSHPSNKSSYDYMFIEMIKDRLINGYDDNGVWVPHDNEVREFMGLTPIEIIEDENLGQTSLIRF